MKGIYTLTCKTDTLSTLAFKVDESTGEIISYVRPSGEPEKYTKQFDAIFHDGRPVIPQNLYIMSRLRYRHERELKDTTTLTYALLLYTRWLDREGLNYDHLSEFQELGAPWLFASYLLENIGNDDNQYALSTARVYMQYVIAFYSYLHREQIVPQSEEKVACHFYQKICGGSRDPDNDMLAHIKDDHDTIVQVSSIMDRFEKHQEIRAHKKLKPLTPDDKGIFHKYLKMEKKPLPLMFRLAEEAGLRQGEFVTFPTKGLTELVVDGLGFVKYKIGPATNGCMTKFSKSRTIEISEDLYNDLISYYYSKDRADNKKGRKFNDDEFEPLFLSRKGRAYKKKTIEKYFELLRKRIREDHPDWYYRTHDLRSTFATEWLETASRERSVSYRYLLDELKDLMGHKNSATTEKYIEFSEVRNDQLAMAKRKNSQG